MKVNVELWRSDINISNDAKKLYGWKRWKHKDLIALREKHNLKHKGKTLKINVGDVVTIKVEEKNRGHCKIGIVIYLYIGKVNIIQVAQLHIGKK